MVVSMFIMLLIVILGYIDSIICLFQYRLQQLQWARKMEAMDKTIKLSTFLVEYEQRLQQFINKKYRPFLRALISAARNRLSQMKKGDVVLGKEVIMFKLGLQAKSPKAVQVSLHYLNTFFRRGLIDLSSPNYCQNFVIEENNVKQIEYKPTTQLRHQLMRLIPPLLHFRTQQIYSLIDSLMQHLVSQPILPTLLQLSVVWAKDTLRKPLFQYFSYRFCVFEDVYTYTEAQMLSFDTLVVRSERTIRDLLKATEEHQRLIDLIARYLNEYVSLVESNEERQCVICGQPATNYCRVTRASLCSNQCKQKHIQLAQRQYKRHFQAEALRPTVYEGFKELLVFTAEKNSLLAVNVISNLMENPFAFMMARGCFRTIIRENIAAVVVNIMNNYQDCQAVYSLVASLARYWLKDTINIVNTFLTQRVLVQLQSRKPQIKLLSLAFGMLFMLADCGRTFVQLYINIDCKLNKSNIIHELLFEVAKLSQDGHPAFSKKQKNTIKSWCVSLLAKISEGMNKYRQQYPRKIDVKAFLDDKQRKTDLQVFVVHFNQHWSNGLKTLFNLNLVVLDNPNELLNILLSVKGLHKQQIQNFIFSQAGESYRNQYISHLIHNTKDTFTNILSFRSSFIAPIDSPAFQYLMKHLNKHSTDNQIRQLLHFLNQPIQHIKKLFPHYSPTQICQSMELMKQAQSPVTKGATDEQFIYCRSASYLEVLSLQISLFQIPLSYLLQTGWDLQCLLHIANELVQVCPQANWILLFIKHCPLVIPLDESKIHHIAALFQLIRRNAPYIIEWTAIVHYIAQVHYLDSAALSEVIDPIEQFILQIGQLCSTHFGTYALALLSNARELAMRNKPFLLQKFFQVCTASIDKCVGDFSLLQEQLCRFVICPLQLEVQVEVAGRLKQFTAKVLKMKTTLNIVRVETSLISLMCILGRDVKVCDFVMNCLNMTIIYHYNLCEESWRCIVQFMEECVGYCCTRIIVALNKIIEEKLLHCQKHGAALIHVCLQIIRCSTEGQQIIQGVNLIQSIIHILIKKQDVKVLVSTTIRQLTSLVKVQCYYEVIEAAMRLMDIRLEERNVLEQGDIEVCIGELFDTLQHNAENNQIPHQLILNMVLKQCLLLQHHCIINHLAALVMNTRCNLAFVALKCLHIYIQKHPQRSDIFSTLAQILTFGRIPSCLKQLNIEEFVYKMNVQRTTVSILPNELKYIPLLKELLKDVIQFNEDVEMRCLLWEAGLGKLDTVMVPPQLLTLEQGITNRMYSIYNECEEETLYQFTLDSFRRLNKYYERADCMSLGVEKKQIIKRIVPLSKLTLNLLPTAIKLCDAKQKKKELLREIIFATAFAQNRTPLLKAIYKLMPDKRVKQK